METKNYSSLHISSIKSQTVSNLLITKDDILSTLLAKIVVTGMSFACYLFLDWKPLIKLTMMATVLYITTLKHNPMMPANVIKQMVQINPTMIIEPARNNPGIP